MKELLEQFELLQIEDITYLYAMLNSHVECQKLFMKLAQENNCVIQKYYWRSSLDETYIELQQPKITDVFYFHCDIGGKYEDIKNVLTQYNKLKGVMLHLDKCLITPLTDNEIKDTAYKLLQHCEII